MEKRLGYRILKKGGWAHCILERETRLGSSVFGNGENDVGFFCILKMVTTTLYSLYFEKGDEVELVLS